MPLRSSTLLDIGTHVGRGLSLRIVFCSHNINSMRVSIFGMLAGGALGCACMPAAPDSTEAESNQETKATESDGAKSNALPGGGKQVLLGMDATSRPNEYRDDRILVEFRPGVDEQRLQALYQRRGNREVRLPGVTTKLSGPRLIQLRQGDSVQQALRAYRAHPDVLYAEPDYLVHLTATPNDTLWSQHWHLNDAEDYDINATQAWDVVTSSGSGVIVVIDSGVDTGHSDLLPNLWVNPNEVAGNSIDDDNNGYVDDIYGIDAISGSGDPTDTHGHGTYVAGIIGAVGDNSNGVVGVNWNTQIVSCRFSDASGTGSTGDIVECLKYALSLKQDYGINVIAVNGSYGSWSYSNAHNNQVTKLQEAGILYVVASGNSGADLDQYASYPASFEQPNLISVAATSETNGLASYSNKGAHRVHVGAPGDNVPGPDLGGGYTTFSGTSAAAPIVTGLAGLLYGENETRDYITLRNLILAGGAPTAALIGNTITGRRVRAHDVGGVGAMTCSSQQINERLKPIYDPLITTRGGSFDFTNLHINCALAAGGSDSAILDGTTPIAIYDDGTNGDVAANDGVYYGSHSLSATTNAPNAHSLALPDGSSVSVAALDPYWPPPTFPVATNNYNYRDITGVQKSLSGFFEEGPMKSFTSSFPVPFGNYAPGFDTFHVSANGFLRLDTKFAPTLDEYPSSLPVARVDNMVSVYWMNLNSNTVYWGELGTAPNRELVIEWRDVAGPLGDCTNIDPSTSEVTGFGSFQIVFHEDSSDVEFHYKDLDWDGNSCDNADGAQRGIQVARGVAYATAAQTPSLTGYVFQANTGPTADAGGDKYATTGNTVWLSGAASSDPNIDRGDALSYSWVQTAGTSVTLSNPTSETTTFTAPATEEALTFELTVTDKKGISDTAAITVTTLNCVPTSDYSYADCDGDGFFQEPVVNRCAGEAYRSPCNGGASPSTWVLQENADPTKLGDCNDADVAVDNTGTEWYVDADADGQGAGDATLACLAPEGSVDNADDCDDGDDTAFLGADEIADDGIDQDCDGVDAVTCIIDLDKDGFGNDAGDEVVALDGSCDTADGESDNTLDCDDANPNAFPDATETAGDGIDQDCNGIDAIECVVDGDLDGYGNAQGTLTTALDGSCDPADGEVETSDDCDDADGNVFPGANETPDDGIDQDCNGTDTITCQVDADMDGFGSQSTTLADDGSCDTAQAESITSDDCQDNDPLIKPDATELPGNGIDENCDGSDAVVCFVDSDQDGFGTSVTVEAGDGTCDTLQSEATQDGDCDDMNADISPTATDIPDNGVDENCSGTDSIQCFVDSDQDGYGSTQTTIAADGNCDTADGEATASGDCDDSDNGVHPGATEVIDNSVDEDCNGGAALTCALDADQDGYGSATLTAVADDGSCDTADREAYFATDCDDSTATIHPGATEIPGNGIDEDCSGADSKGPSNDTPTADAGAPADPTPDATEDAGSGSNPTEPTSDREPDMDGGDPADSDDEQEPRRSPSSDAGADSELSDSINDFLTSGDEGGCGCRAAGAPDSTGASGPGYAWILGLLPMAWAARRRRRP